MKTPARDALKFDSISALMRQLGLPKPLHPQVALISYSDVNVNLANAGKSYVLNFYKISFKKNFSGQVKYGQGYYDFEEGGMAFLAPHQVVTMSGDENSYEGYSLFFHPDLIRNYTLGKSISKYGFFSYAISESLFLSDREKNIIAALFEAISHELEHHIDHFSQDILVSQLEQLLNYSNRFYNRQFITRKLIYTDLTVKLEAYLDSRFDIETPALVGLPTVQEVSDYMELSPRYLTDVLKSLTGQSTQQLIHYKLIEKAKDLLSTGNLSVAEIAYGLGFEHPQSFNKLFKQKTKVSPAAFRQSFE